MEYEIKISDDYKYYINDIEINESIFDDEKVEYFIKEREDFIDTLIDWIGDCGRDRENDKNLMKEDLKMLINRKEKFLFSSIKAKTLSTFLSITSFPVGCPISCWVICFCGVGPGVDVGPDVKPLNPLPIWPPVSTFIILPLSSSVTKVTLPNLSSSLNILFAPCFNPV